MRMAGKIAKGLLLVVLGVTVFGWVTKELWNWLMPSIFGLRTITFAQAIGLVLLGKILFGGFHKHGHGPGGGWRSKREWKRRMQDRWDAMSEEERATFRAGMKERWGCGFGRDARDFGREAAGFGHDRPATQETSAH